MKIQLAITANDYLSLLKFVRRHVSGGKNSKFSSTANFIFTVLISGVVGYLGASLARRYGIKLHYSTILATFIFTVALFIFFSKIYVKKLLPRKDGVLLGSHEYEFTDTHFIDVAASYETRMKWDAFLAYRETQTHYFLFVDTAMAYILPKQYIDSPETESDLKRVLSEKIRSM